MLFSLNNASHSKLVFCEAFVGKYQSHFFFVLFCLFCVAFWSCLLWNKFLSLAVISFYTHRAQGTPSRCFSPGCHPTGDHLDCHGNAHSQQVGVGGGGMGYGGRTHHPSSYWLNIFMVDLKSDYIWVCSIDLMDLKRLDPINKVAVPQRLCSYQWRANLACKLNPATIFLLV